MAKKSDLKKLEDKVWQECRRITFDRYNKDGAIDCYTCGAKNIEGVNRQLGHCYPKGACGTTMKMDLRHLRFQCYHCNINCGGMGAVFKSNLEKELGKDVVEQIEKDYWLSKSITVKAKDYYTDLLLKLQEFEKSI